MAQRIIHIIFLIGAALFGAGVILFFANNTCYGQMTYYGPTSPVPGLVKIEVQLYDDPDLGGVTIEEASLNHQSIALKPAGIRGYRGGGSFQLAPGTYQLEWRVSRQKKDWPRTIRHVQKIQVGANNVWIQVIVRGEKVEVI